VVPPCEQRRAGCGGCDWQHLDPKAQLAAKVEIVRDAMRRTARLPDGDIRIGETVGHEGYRTTVRVVGDAAGVPSYRIERSHDTIGAHPCLVSHPLLQPILASARITPDLEVTFRVSNASGEATASWNPQRGEVTSLPDNVATGPDAFVREEVGRHSFRVSSRSFFQSGPDAARLLVTAVRQMAPELVDADIVLDAYAGVGLFAMAATSETSRLIVLESSKFAFADACFNLSSRISHVEKVDVGRWRHQFDRRVDVAIADPSRSGLGKKGVDALTTTNTPVLVLVSCDPVALARDTALLSAAGYRHDGTEVHDVFPHTHHVECVTRFVQA
jgi:23S rRNA (uracil1939-C5)-methyltransferase